MMTNWNIQTFLILFISLLYLSGGCKAQSTGQMNEKVMIIDLPIEKSLGQDEALRALLHVGVLPLKAWIEVRNSDGEILGSVRPYGILPGQKVGIHVIAIPNSLIVKNKVQLHIIIIDSGERAPISKELEKVELSVVKITH